MNLNKRKFYGDQYLETEDWFNKLPKDLLDTLMFNGITAIPIDQAWYMFRGYNQKFQDAIGYIIVKTFLRDHPEYAEKLKNNDVLPPQDLNKDQSYDMFR